MHATSRKNFLNTKIVYFKISNCIFNCNFLALVLSEILGGPKVLLGALHALDAP